MKIRDSATYCAQVAAKPSLISNESHAREIAREHRIVELQRGWCARGPAGKVLRAVTPA